MSTSHHGGDGKRALDEIIKRFVAQGDGSANRAYPAGRLGAHDEGELAFAVGTDRGRVVVQFNKPVAWLGMTGGDAVRLAEMLVKHAKSLGKPVALEI